MRLVKWAASPGPAAFALQAGRWCRPSCARCCTCSPPR